MLLLSFKIVNYICLLNGGESQCVQSDPLLLYHGFVNHVLPIKIYFK